MEYARTHNHFILTEHEKQIAVRALREDRRLELADTLERASLNREIDQRTLNLIAESVGALAVAEDWGAMHFMSEYQRLEI